MRARAGHPCVYHRCALLGAGMPSNRVLCGLSVIRRPEGLRLIETSGFAWWWSGWRSPRSGRPFPYWQPALSRRQRRDTLHPSKPSGIGRLGRHREAEPVMPSHAAREPPEGRFAECEPDIGRCGMDATARAKPLRAGEIARSNPPPHCEEIDLIHQCIPGCFGCGNRYCICR